MCGFEPALKTRLRRLKVRVASLDDDTIVLRNVPADARRFSKAQTSVLVQRPRAGLPFVVGVDADLEYLGPDQELARAFAAADRRQGWLVVSGRTGVFAEAAEAVRQTLVMLGAPEDAATAGAAQPAAEGGVLARLSTNLTAQVLAGGAPQTAGWGEAAEQAAASLLTWQHRLPVIIGAPGQGKTNLLYQVARHLAAVRPGWEFHSLDVASLLAGALWEGEREKLLNTALEAAACRDGLVLGLDRLELAVLSVPFAPWLFAAALDRGARLIATCLPPFAERLSQGPLARRLELIDLPELAPAASATALGMLRETLESHHGVAIGLPVVEAALTRSLSLAGRLPDKAITLLDAAAARAALLGQPTVTEGDVFLAASRMKEA
jgi:ATP-dependent Clp protease ATP-binding subunit ClpA